MENIKIFVDQDRDLTTYVVTGKVSVKPIVPLLEELYSAAATLYLLWDFSQADASETKTSELNEIFTFSKEKARVRKEGKRAIVAPRDLEYGMGRMYEIFADVYKHPVPLRVFRTRDEAMKWLFEDEQRFTGVKEKA
jgi:hypothetical protein